MRPGLPWSPYCCIDLNVSVLAPLSGFYFSFPSPNSVTPRTTGSGLVPPRLICYLACYLPGLEKTEPSAEGKEVVESKDWGEMRDRYDWWTKVPEGWPSAQEEELSLGNRTDAPFSEMFGHIHEEDSDNSRSKAVPVPLVGIASPDSSHVPSCERQSLATQIWHFTLQTQPGLAQGKQEWPPCVWFCSLRKKW